MLLTCNNIKTPIKGIQYLLDKNNLLHHCITDTDWYVHVVTLYINKLNFFEVQNIHPKNKRNFHINISVETI